MMVKYTGWFALLFQIGYLIAFCVTEREVFFIVSNIFLAVALLYRDPEIKKEEQSIDNMSYKELVFLLRKVSEKIKDISTRI